MTAAETNAADADDYIAAFAKKHRLDETELRECIAMGPVFVRHLLADFGIMDAYPRAPRSARTEAAK